MNSLFNNKIFSLLNFSSFNKTSESNLFSSAIVDVFTHLTEYYQAIKKLDLDDRSVIAKYMQRFSLAISQVLFAYANEIRRTFEHVAGHDHICSILINNIQQPRLYLERLYESMGAAQLDNETKSRLNTLQKSIKRCPR